MREALDLGINFIDTAEAYGTEDDRRQGHQGRPRDSIVLSTKSLITGAAGPKSGADMVASLDASLRRLGTDYVDSSICTGWRPPPTTAP